MASYLALNGAGKDNTASATSLSFTTTRDIQIGEHVVVAGGHNTGGSTPTSVTVGGLALTQRVNSATTKRAFIWSARATSLIAAGSTVTISWVTGVTGAYGHCLSLQNVDAVPTILTATANFLIGSPTQNWNSGLTAAVAAGGVAVMVATVNQNPLTMVSVSPFVTQDTQSIGTASNGVATCDNVSPGPQQGYATMTPAGGGDCPIAVFSGTQDGPLTGVNPLLQRRRRLLRHSGTFKG